jgi:hypothetical protein
MPTLTQEPPYSILGTYLFYGEEFSIDEEDDQIILYHPLWSLAALESSFTKPSRI